MMMVTTAGIHFFYGLLKDVLSKQDTRRQTYYMIPKTSYSRPHLVADLSVDVSLQLS